MAEVRIQSHLTFTAFAVGLPGNATVHADSARNDRSVVLLEWSNDPSLERRAFYFSLDEALAIGQALLEVAGAITAQLGAARTEEQEGCSDG